LPIVWYDTTSNDSADFEYDLLPRLGGTGTGEVRGHFGYDMADTHFVMAGWSTPPSGVQNAVAWLVDYPGGPYVIETLPGYGEGLTSCANDVMTTRDTTYLAFGWAETGMGLIHPQRWWRDDMGTWTRVPMPLPEGAIEGAVNSITYEEEWDETAHLEAAGWVEDVMGTRYPALWIKLGPGVPWVARQLAVLAGYDEGEAHAAKLVGEEGDDTYVVGTCYTGDVSTGVLWSVAEQGDDAYDLDDLIVGSSAGIEILEALDMVVSGPDPIASICGHGVGMGGMTLAPAEAIPLAYLLTEEPGAALVRPQDSGCPDLRLAVSPNPFRSEVRVSYSLGRDTPVRLSVYDIEGRLVRVLVDNLKRGGAHAAAWDGLDSRGRRAGSGIYFLQLRAGGHRTFSKIVLFE
jgi:hypothetical protein